MGVLSQPALLPSLQSHHGRTPTQRHKLLSSGHRRHRYSSPRLGGSHGVARFSQHVPSSSWRWGDDEDANSDSDDVRFEQGVGLFNGGEYYKCHDVMEGLWMKSGEPKRTILHSILQCSVGLYHLLNQNHRGAMTGLGESLAKLRRQRFVEGPLLQFEREVSAVLEYIYSTQLEHAACTEDLCITMDGSQKSYLLLGDFASGQPLYDIQRASEDGKLYIVFTTRQTSAGGLAFLKVKVPSLNITADDFSKLK